MMRSKLRELLERLLGSASGRRALAGAAGAAALLLFVGAVEAAGGKVARVLCLVDRGEGAREAFAERGIELEAIFTRADLPV